jgi:two-component system, sensor histidine kinase
VKIAEVSLDPNSLDPGHDFVFRDFERSKFQVIRSILETDSGRLSLLYLIVVVFWTILMSFAAQTHGDDSFAINTSPHIAHYTLIIGVLLYPMRRMWIPLAAFTSVYLIPFIIPNMNGISWLDLPSLDLSLLAMGYLVHILSSLLIGGVALIFARKLLVTSAPYTVDLFTTLTVFAAFLLFCGIQVWSLWAYANTLPLAARLELGFGPDFLHAAAERVLRGAVVAAGFLLAVLEVPTRRVFLQSLALALLFPLLAWAQFHGFAIYPTLDACILALLLVITLPVSIGIGTSIIGIPIYSAMTGAFVSTAYLNDPIADTLEHYAILIIVLAVMASAWRAFVQHTLRQREASMRRLSMVRDFANVGLLSFNLDRQRFRADASTQRLLKSSAEGSVTQLETLFDGSDKNHLKKALRSGQNGSVNLLLAGPSLGGQAQVLRMCLWYEKAPSGEQVAYGLVLDVTAEHRQERALKETLAELSSRQERQRQLFSIISHELRTPASVVSMLVEDLDPQNVAPVVRKQLRDATDQLLSTLADMRQTVNPSQNLPIHRAPFAAADLAESIRYMYAAQATEHGMTIRLSLCDASRVMRIGDQMRMRQAVSNVVRNAIIHSKGHEVVMRFDAVDGPKGPISRWTITDDGIGIPASDVDRLFRPFERGVQDPRSHADGSGLGLFIAKSSVEMLGGSIAHFAPDTGGTGYCIDVPEQIASTAPQTPSADLNAYETARFPDLYVLLAEDNTLVAEVTLAKLSKFVGRVDIAANGREAIDMIDTQMPDLLITDLFMPEMDGDDLIRTLRARQIPVPIIGLTAAVVGDDIERLQLAGADAVMSKPIDMRGLRKFIHQKWGASAEQPENGAA